MRFRYEYGASPVHLLAAIASFLIAAWALSQALEVLSSPGRFLIWLGASIVAHDLILLPLYSAVGAAAVGTIARGRTRIRIAALNHLRVPALLSGLALLVWFPLVLGTGDSTFTSASGLSNEIYLERWLALSAVLFAGSALGFALRARGLRRWDTGADE